MSDTKNIDYIIDEIVTLPSQPSTLARITELMHDPECSLHDVGRVISADPGIAIKALRLVNSAHYGLRQPVVSIEHAVMLLGLKVIRNLVISAIAFETFKKGAEELLEHCVACGLAMRSLVAEWAGEESEAVENAFVYGLLHDVGKILMKEYLPDEMAEVEELVREKAMPPFKAEQEIIGCDHAELGSRLAQHWKLPGDLVGAIAGHHELTRCGYKQAARSAALLTVANFMCWEAGLESVEGGRPIRPDKTIWQLVAMDNRSLKSVLNRFFDYIPQIDEIIEIAE